MARSHRVTSGLIRALVTAVFVGIVVVGLGAALALGGLAVGVIDSGSETVVGDGAAGSTGVNETTVERLVVENMNAERRAVGRDALKRDADLREPARAHAADMHARDFYGHENPDGEQPWDRAACQAGENIHRGDVMRDLRGWGTSETFDTTTAEGMAAYIVSGWANSEQGHYETMTSHEHQFTGVGVAIEDDEVVAVAMFC